MQAIARVNCIFRDKPGGHIVDYIGISDSLKEALKQYTDNSDRRNKGIDTSLAVNLMLEKFEIIQEMLYKHNYDHSHLGKVTECMKAITEKMDYVIGLGEEEKSRFLKIATELGKAFALCATEC